MTIQEHINLLQSALDDHDHRILTVAKMKIAILSETLRQAATALEKARPSVKARAVESADDAQYDDLVGEINRVLFRIKELKLQ